MAKSDSRRSRRRNGRRGGRRKGNGDIARTGAEAAIRRWLDLTRLKLAVLTLLFASSVVFVCFYGQAPPATRSLLPGTISPGSVFAEQTFTYESVYRAEMRREEFRRDNPQYHRHLALEERFREALALFETGLAQNMNGDEEGLASANRELGEELRKSHGLELTPETLAAFSRVRNPSGRESVYQTIQRELNNLHKIGVLKNPSRHFKFRSEANATAELESALFRATGSLAVIGETEEVLDLLLEVGDLPHLGPHVEDLLSDGNLTAEGVSLSDLTSGGDDANATARARSLREDMATAFASLAGQGLILREYDADATESEVDRKMEEEQKKGAFAVTVQEGDRIIRKDHSVTEENHEMYAEYLDQTVSERALLPRRILLTCATFLFALLYVNLVLPDFWRNDAKTAIVAVAILSNLLISRGVLELGGTDLFGGNPLLLASLPYLLPVAFAPMVIMITVGPRMAALSALMTSVFHAAMEGSEVEALAISIGASLTGAFFCQDADHRWQVLRAGALAGFVAAVLAVAFGFATGHDLAVIALLAGAAIITGGVTGALVTGVLPLFENFFKVTTEVTLLELTDFNHPLLRRMQLEAPGTYHHSLMVANLAENAAAAVGANPRVCRACSLFHDVGKMVQPEYFTENQTEADNPHLRRNPSMSALIIKSHVKEGVEMAREHRLPEVMIDIILQHHGTTLVKFFYHEAKRKMRQEQLPLSDGVEPDEPDESTYRYDGPKPQFRESAVIFFADSVEAAARSLRKVTRHSVEELVDAIFADRLEDRQLDECPLTLEEVALIKSSFTSTILNMLHSRIEYPEEDKADKKGRGSGGRRTHGSEEGDKAEKATGENRDEQPI